MKNKRGISLIVLVITIVVIIILAAAVILTLNQNNPVENAKQAKFKSDIDAFQSSVTLYIGDQYVKDTSFDYKSLQADKTSITQNTITKATNIQGIIPEMKDSYYLDRLEVQNGKLVYRIEEPKLTNEEEKWFDEMLGNGGATPTPPTGNLDGGTTNKDEAAWNKPYIPVEFKYLEGTVDTGYVIVDKTNGNEFVWVPVKNIADYKRGVTGDATNINGTSSSGFYEDDTNPINVAIKKSVEDYQGFYIGRYEIGLSDSATYRGTLVDGTYWINAEAVVKKNAKPWNYITQTKAVAVCSKMYQGETKSSLINPYVWDTTLNWILSSFDKTPDKVLKNSSTWGNYIDATFAMDANASYSTASSSYTTYLNDKTDKPVSKDWLLTTGATKRNSTKNIYDMAGNLWEWTTEMSGSSYRVIRGGNFFDVGSGVASCRHSNAPSDFNFNIGARCVLYIP